jgi:hypothetical protein
MVEAMAAATEKADVMRALTEADDLITAEIESERAAITATGDLLVLITPYMPDDTTPLGEAIAAMPPDLAAKAAHLAALAFPTGYVAVPMTDQ